MAQLDRAEQTWPVALAILTAALLLCWPAFYNGYPFAYGDSASYLDTLDPRKAFWARPVFYTLFLFPFHWRLWLWPAIYVQALIMAHLLYLVLRGLCPAIRPETYLGLVGIVAALSSLPWFISTIMPDVFTGAVVLGLYLLGFAADRLTRLERGYVVLLTAGAIACHLSHIPLAIGLLVVILVLQPWLVQGARFRVLVAAPVALAVVAHLAVNAYARHEVSLSPASPIFLLARLIGDGPALAYLEDTCPERHFKLCAYLDDIPPDSDTFLWDKDSVFMRAGGPALRDEAREIVAGSLETFPAWALGNMALNAVRQFFDMGTGDWLVPNAPSDRVSQYIAHFFPNAAEDYAGSRQNTGRIPLIALRVSHALFALTGLTASFFLMLEFARRRQMRPVALFLVILAGLIGNAIITGGLSAVHARYQSRIIWLVVFYAAVGVLAFIRVPAPSAEHREAGRHRPA